MDTIIYTSSGCNLSVMCIYLELYRYTMFTSSMVSIGKGYWEFVIFYFLNSENIFFYFTLTTSEMINATAGAQNALYAQHIPTKKNRQPLTSSYSETLLCTTNK